MQQGQLFDEGKRRITNRTLAAQETLLVRIPRSFVSNIRFFTFLYTLFKLKYSFGRDSGTGSFGHFLFKNCLEGDLQPSFVIMFRVS